MSEVVSIDRSTVDKAQTLATGIEAIARWRQILAVRWFALLALVGGIAVWGATIIAPDMWRFVAALGYSLGVFIPTLVLYWLRSD